MPKWNWCPNSRYYYRRIDEAGVIYDTPFPCKSWECPYCGTRKYNELRPLLERALICETMEARDDAFHVTLTMDPSRISRKQAWATIGKRFDRFRRGLQRANGNVAPTYVRVVAQQRVTEYPHLHLLLIFQRNLSDLSSNKLRNCLHELWGPHDGGGFVRVKRIEGREALLVRVRYIMRDLRSILPHLPKGSRRVSVSKDIKFWDQDSNRAKPPKTDKAKGQRRCGDILNSAAALRRKRYHVTLGARGLIAIPPPRA